MASAYGDPVPSTSGSGQQKISDPADELENGTGEESLDALTADFRTTLGLLPDEEEGLTEAFKARIGLLGGESINAVAELELVLEEETEETLAHFKFSKYAKNNFQKGHSAEFSNSPIKEPLLLKKHELDRLASLAVWLAIQRYMGDIPTPKAALNIHRRSPVMSRIYRNMEAFNKRNKRRTSSTTSPDDTSAATPAEQDSFKLRKRKSWKKIFRQKSKDHIDVGRRDSVFAGYAGEVDYGSPPETLLENIPGEELELIHFIIGHGILRRDLRDEIFCQIIKQLNKNPSAPNVSRGWVLLALSTGSFSPSDSLARYLRSYFMAAPAEFKEYAEYGRKMIRRTTINGTRYHPPCWIEYQAMKMKKYIMLPTALADKTIQDVEADAATTAFEMSEKLANKVGLRDQFGFSVFICIYDKVSSLGSGSDHVMDAVAECEQILRSNNRKEEEAPWRLYFRKELFTPWHDPSYDEVATNLIFHQICRGVRSEEYRMSGEGELVRHVARCYFVDNGAQVVPGKLQSNLQKYMPKGKLSGNKSRDGWTQAVIAAMDDLNLTSGRVTAKQVKENIVHNSARKWPLHFSSLFEAFRIAGPRLPKNEAIVALNSTGFLILDEPYKVHKALEYYEVVEVFSSRTEKVHGQSFSLLTIRGDEYTFISPHADTITRMLQFFLNGLRLRSRWAIALEHYRLEGEGVERGFQMRQGDVVKLLSNDKAKETEEGWLRAECQRTGQTGKVPRETVYLIPALEKPSDTFLDMFSSMTSENMSTLPRTKGAVVLTKGTIGRHGLHGLETVA